MWQYMFYETIRVHTLQYTEPHTRSLHVPASFTHAMKCTTVIAHQPAFLIPAGLQRTSNVSKSSLQVLQAHMLTPAQFQV